MCTSGCFGGPQASLVSDARFLRSDLQTNRSHSVMGPFMIRLRSQHLL